MVSKLGNFNYTVSVPTAEDIYYSNTSNISLKKYLDNLSGSDIANISIGISDLQADIKSIQESIDNITTNKIPQVERKLEEEVAKLNSQIVALEEQIPEKLSQTLVTLSNQIEAHGQRLTTLESVKVLGLNIVN